MKILKYSKGVDIILENKRNGYVTLFVSKTCRLGMLGKWSRGIMLSFGHLVLDINL